MGWQTHIVTCCTCFLAGSTFHHWIADHNTLWTNPTTEEAVSRAVRYYTLLGSVRYTPLPYIWLAIACIAAGTMAWRSIRGLTSSKGEKFNGGYLFDAACCLLLVRVIVTQASDVFPAVLALSPSSPSPSSPNPFIPGSREYQAVENSVRRLAGTNLTISVLLTGVACLQAGRFYAERSAAKKRAQYLSTQPESSSDSSSSGPLDQAATAVEDATTPVPDYSSGSVGSAGSSAGGKKTRRRAQTPYREMTEEELLELNQSEKPAR
ncbi:hypothetical protein FFLO_01188 [Filobasidium floriforme]|uniref:Uncharacterized protein n=1 Tax=Filobasidium floriforme TaxID=5210 RepID=A0A8K0JQ47_9TREE|nr:hypothetical protein FFLO_01188 [Filobasidium floriforme]